MSTEVLNNLAFSSIAMAMIIEKTNKLELSKVMLIMPFLAHKDLLSYLADGRTNVKGLDKLIVDKLHCFSNFNKRYYDNFITSINSVQFLSEVGLVSLENNLAISERETLYINSMGKRLKKVSKASSNLATILSEDTSTLYLNLRIEL